MGAAASHAAAQPAQHAEHYPHDRQDKCVEDDGGVSDISESDVDATQKGPTYVQIKDAKNPPIGNSMNKETYSMAVCRPDSASADCRSCVPRLKFPLPAAEDVTFPGPVNDYEQESKPRGPRKQGHYARNMSEHGPELQRTLTQTSDGGWPTEYLDWLKKDQGLTSGRREMTLEEKEAAAMAAEAEQEFKAMSAQLSTEEKARKDLERGGLDAPLLGGGTKDLGRYSRSSIKGKLVVLGLLLLVLCWLGGGGHEVGHWYTSVERAREERAEAAQVAAKAAAAERVAEQAKEEKVAEEKEAAAEEKEAAAEEKEAAEERAAANEAAAEKAAAEKAARLKKMRGHLSGGDGVPAALVIVGMLLVAAAVGYCC